MIGSKRFGSLVDQRLGKYHVQKMLGSGAFGIVYLAVDTVNETPVAIKVPRIKTLVDADRRERFFQEAAHTPHLESKGIVRLLENHLDEPIPFLVMEYCDGPDLSQWLAAQTELATWQESVALVRGLAQAVADAHDQNIYHRDLKPANVLLTLPNASASTKDTLASLTPKVADFGLAKLIDPMMSDTRSSLVVGTPSYMAPERLIPAWSKANTSRERLVAIDVYSLGVILFELLAGQLPITGGTYATIMDQIRYQRPLRLNDLRKGLPKDLAIVCEKCLEKDPRARYQSARAFAEDLDKCVHGQRVSARKARVISKFHYWCTRPERMQTAVWFTLASHVMLAFWTFQALPFIQQYGVVSGDQLRSVIMDATIVSLGINLPCGFLAWMTLRNRRWAAWAGVFLTIINIPGIAYATVKGPLLFQALYHGHAPYFSSNTHAIILVCFAIQLFLFCCAIVSESPKESDA